MEELVGIKRQKCKRELKLGLLWNRCFRESRCSYNGMNFPSLESKRCLTFWASKCLSRICPTTFKSLKIHGFLYFCKPLGLNQKKKNKKKQQRENRMDLLFTLNAFLRLDRGRIAQKMICRNRVTFYSFLSYLYNHFWLTTGHLAHMHLEESCY